MKEIYFKKDILEKAARLLSTGQWPDEITGQKHHAAQRGWWLCVERLREIAREADNGDPVAVQLNMKSLLKSADKHLRDSEDVDINDERLFELDEALSFMLLAVCDGLNESQLKHMLNEYMNHVRQE